MVSQYFILSRVADRIPVSREVDPLLEIDRNPRKMEAFLASKLSNNTPLNIKDLRKFLPCTINLDPYLRKLIRGLFYIQVIKLIKLALNLFA